jgi:hypothetical protein
LLRIWNVFPQLAKKKEQTKAAILCFEAPSGGMKSFEALKLEKWFKA